MRNVIAGLLLVFFGGVTAVYTGSAQLGPDTVANASSLVSRHLLAFEKEPSLDLSSYLVRGDEAQKSLAADLLRLQSAAPSGAQQQTDAAIEFTSRANSVIRTYTLFRMANLKAGMTHQRPIKDEGALAQETDPTLKDRASQRLQADKAAFEQQLRELNHQKNALSMHCEMLLRANEAVKAAFGDAQGLDAPTQAFMQSLL